MRPKTLNLAVNFVKSGRSLFKNRPVCLKIALRRRLVKKLVKFKIALAFCHQIAAMPELANGKRGANLKTTFCLRRPKI